MRGTAVTQTVMALSDFLNGSFLVALLAGPDPKQNLGSCDWPTQKPTLNALSAGAVAVGTVRRSSRGRCLRPKRQKGRGAAHIVHIGGATRLQMLLLQVHTRDLQQQKRHQHRRQQGPPRAPARQRQ